MPAVPTAPTTQAKADLINPMIQSSEGDRFLSSGPEDCEPSVDPEDFGKGGVNKADLINPLTQSSEGDRFLSSGSEDCEPSVDLEVFGRGGVGVDSEYDLELRISGNMGRPGMVLTALKTVRW